MTDATLIADLVRAGVGADLVGRVSNALLNVRDNVRDKSVKEHERERKRKWRETTAAVKDVRGAQANDGARAGINSVPQNVPDIVENHCDLSSLSSSVKGLVEEGSEEKKKEAVTKSARGTRMSPDAQITPDEYQFAISAGMTPDATRALWVEFVDFWITVPGQRGVKLNWFATWRNRVRAVGANGARNISQGKPNVAEDRSLVAAARRASDNIKRALELGDRPSEPVFRIVSQS
jgi:hypothetical protein